ncbi:MAG: homoserine dehydrogenase [Ignisphaera sp.]
MKNVNIVVMGFGNVGRAFVKTVSLKKKVIAEKYGVNINIVAVGDSKGVAIKKEGFDEYELLKMSELPRSSLHMFSPYGRQGVDIEEIYRETEPHIHVELTPSNYLTGEPGYSNILFALRNNVHVVTANKAPLVLHYNEIISEARSRGLSVRFRATVLGGTPFLEMLSSMKSHDIERVEGILNATTNYILTEMHENLVDFEQALKKAQAIGVAEADPTLDIEGFDAAAKLCIISHIIGKPVDMNSVYRESLSKVTLKDVLDAVRQGQVIKYIALLDTQNKVASVRIVRLSRDNILAQVGGVLNAVRVKTDATELFFVGRGGGRIETAHSVFDDVLSIVLEKVINK